MSDLRPQVRAAIENFLSHHQDQHVANDILRVIQEEAILMKATEDVRDALVSDPYEHFEDISPKSMKKFKDLLRVVSLEQVRVGDSVARTHAVVAWPNHNKDNIMQLTFLYERRPRRGIIPNPENGEVGCQVSYTIELAYGHWQRQKMLEVIVWAASNVPSHEPAVCIQSEMEKEEDEEDGWEDIDEDVEKEQEDASEKLPTTEKSAATASNYKPKKSLSPDIIPLSKKQKTNNGELEEKSIEDDDEDGIDTKDQYVAFLDPDVLQSFLESSGMLPMDDATAFFLLMTFPFFEHEWDIVGFVLDQFFGKDNGSDGDNDDGDGDDER